MIALMRQIRRGVAALLSPARVDADMDNEIRHFVHRRARMSDLRDLPHSEQHWWQRTVCRPSTTPVDLNSKSGKA